MIVDIRKVKAAVFNSRSLAQRYLKEALNVNDGLIAKALLDKKREIMYNSMSSSLKVLYLLGVPLASETDMHNVKIPEREEYNIAMFTIKGDKRYSEYLRLMRLSSELEKKIQSSCVNLLSDEEMLFVDELSNSEW